MRYEPGSSIPCSKLHINGKQVSFNTLESHKFPAMGLSGPRITRCLGDSFLVCLGCDSKPAQPGVKGLVRMYVRSMAVSLNSNRLTGPILSRNRFDFLAGQLKKVRYFEDEVSVY